MARSNGPFGPRAPLGRRPGDDALAGPAPQWPAQGYPDHGQQPQAGQGYHFPPPEPEPGYGYNQQPYAPQQQWGPQSDQQGYDLASYLPAEPGPFRHHQQQQAYADTDTDADYSEEFFEDEEPRRGRRWILICAALVGAIGVGGALAYTYRSIVADGAPGDGRVPVVRAEPNVKVKPENPGGREFPGTDRKLPNRLDAGTAAQTVGAAQEQPAGEERNLGPRPVKTIPIGSQPEPVAPPQVAAVPGITLQGVSPPRAEPTPEPKAAEPPPAAERVTIGEPPPPPVEADDPPPAPVKRSPPPVVAKATPPPRAAPPPKAAPPPRKRPPPAPSSGLGYVTVLSSQKTRIDALKAFANVAEKHPDVLSGKTPDVQEANLGERGIWYRAVVGPPGSREAARNLCDQLKAAGQDCWIKQY